MKATDDQINKALVKLAEKYPHAYVQIMCSVEYREDCRVIIEAALDETKPKRGSK